ncbi:MULTISPECIES: tRNA dihydrouridine synthase DusB [Carboxydocella]|uniref:tRNA-dihydrouridine synthase n=2 Tax=Carboxydocella TaxID=178898 RepID=A0A1T4RLV2_9FIRM|nr:MULTISPECIES: tRNA dihydrouridine synthase DusB [Carboxydocella]AVX19319.1 tRNA-U20-dihydrouridine synthase [Carboxydocella thermautotrophica]AVX29733.1 tRNA-U20-dihydrouridine synthase [Carboxydocella thermautotrophica]GAW30388.1 tRNA dihydrouridine synthase DusB [Carboxydocella sp. JDF658]SKA16942.1 tRNA-U20-dihydrouridine synthase [Carboxydocella sporoproducens DSM 16521]
MKIGGVRLANRVFAAPMAGVTDRSFRQLAREMGCGLVYTEMISDLALLYSNKKTLEMVDIGDEPKPIAVQIFGSRPEEMARAAELVEEAGATIIDINMGCPAPKIVRNNEGAALMRDPELAGRIVEAVCSAVKVPVTVKMRKGWDENSVNVLEVAKIVEAAGAKAVTIHGRTRSQMYSGQADWRIIAAVKTELKIPVIGNGDIWTPQDAARMLAETGCDAVMIGRGALGNPWIFRRTVHYLATGELLPEPTAAEKVQMAKRHLDLLLAEKGEYIAVREMRKHAAWYVKGLREATRLREEINKATSAQEVKDCLDQYLAHLSR